MNRVKRTLAVAMLGAALAGCTKVSNQTTASGEHPWTKPGILRISIQSEPNNLNTLLASNTTDGMIDRLIGEGLTSADPKGHLVPVVASVVPTQANGGISKNGLTVTFHLRKDVAFSDGVPLTSKDVKFSWQAMMNPDNNVVSRHGFDEVQSVDTPDAFTVVLHLKERFAPIVSAFFGESDSPTNLAPAHLLAQYPNINQIPFNNAPIGAGPYKFAEWVKGDHITLVPNEHYFRGKPRLIEISIRVIPDENTELSELRTHDIDWMFEPSFSTVPALNALKGSIDSRYTAIDGYEGMQLNTQHWPLHDVRVRRALAYALNKKELLDTLTFGEETLATEDLPNWMWAYNHNVTIYPYDVAKAKQLLGADGFRPGSDGILTKDGQRFSLVLVSNGSNVTRKKAAELIQSMYKQIGVEVQIKFFDGATLFAPAGNGGILQSGKFDLGVDGWFSGVDPDNSSNYMCKNIPPGGYDYSRYCTPAMDAAEKTALTEYGPVKRKAAYAEIEELLATDSPQLFFWWDRQVQAVNPDFKGFDPNPVTESWNAYTWNI